VSAITRINEPDSLYGVIHSNKVCSDTKILSYRVHIRYLIHTLGSCLLEMVASLYSPELGNINLFVIYSRNVLRHLPFHLIAKIYFRH